MWALETRPTAPAKENAKTAAGRTPRPMPGRRWLLLHLLLFEPTFTVLLHLVRCERQQLQRGVISVLQQQSRGHASAYHYYSRTTIQGEYIAHYHYIQQFSIILCPPHTPLLFSYGLRGSVPLRAVGSPTGRQRTSLSLSLSLSLSFPTHSLLMYNTTPYVMGRWVACLLLGGVVGLSRLTSLGKLTSLYRLMLLIFALVLLDLLRRNLRSYQMNTMTIDL